MLCLRLYYLSGLGHRGRLDAPMKNQDCRGLSPISPQRSAASTNRVDGKIGGCTGLYQLFSFPASAA